MSTQAMPKHLPRLRGNICAACSTPCSGQRSADFHAAACARCPLPVPLWNAYGGHRCGEYEGRPRETEASALAEPTVRELATNFAGAMERWAGAGFPTVSADQYAQRAAACEACELWDGKARLGLGKCNAPGCGCTKFKRWLKTEQCKHPAGSRWPALA